MGLLGLFKRKPGGIIANFGLQDFYVALTVDEINQMKEALGHPYQLTTGKPYTGNDLDKGDRKYPGSKSSFLHNMAAGTSDTLKVKLYEAAILHATNVTDRHFPRQDLAEHQYKVGAFEECERLCLEDVAEAKSFLKPKWSKGARMQTFKRLAIMYEKQGRYQDAISISEKALSIDQDDGTKGGYAGRIERLRKKL